MAGKVGGIVCVGEVEVSRQGNREVGGCVGGEGNGRREVSIVEGRVLSSIGVGSGGEACCGSISVGREVGLREERDEERLMKSFSAPVREK